LRSTSIDGRSSRTRRATRSCRARCRS
jgi:hypothetical protein